MKIVFLDIDGPVIPSTMFLTDRNASWKRIASPLAIAVLNELCDRTGARIVFNTTHNRDWAGVPPIDIALMEQGLKPEHLHPTDRKTAYPEVDRSAAVDNWLRDHPETTEWVALDDAKFTDDPRLVLVDVDSGLHLGHLNQALELLGSSAVLVLI